MREAVLIVIVGLICLAALFRPRIGLYGYVWFTLMRPDFFAWSLHAGIPYSAALALTTLVSSLRYVGQFPILVKSPVMRLLLLFQVPLIISVSFAEKPWLAQRPFWEFERMMAAVVLIPILIDSRKELNRLLLVIGLSVGAVGLKFGLFGLVRGGVLLYEGYAGLDNNGLAIRLAAAVPLLWYCRYIVAFRPVRWVLLAMAFASLAAVIMTNSRGGSLALATGLLLIVLRSRRKVAILFLLAVMTFPSVYLFRERYFSRMSTLKDPTADMSVSSRLLLYQAAFDMWKDYPWTGVGFGNNNFMALERQYIELPNEELLKVHNGYLQILVDTGIFGFLIWVLSLWTAIVLLGLLARKLEKTDLLGRSDAFALQTALIALAQYNLTGATEQDGFFYILLAATACCVQVLRNQPPEPSAVPEPSPASEEIPAGASTSSVIQRRSTLLIYPVHAS